MRTSGFATLRFAVLALTLACASFAPMAARATQSGCDHGTWAGTLGTMPISMELEAGSARKSATGHYYYRASMTDLLLKRNDSSGEWKELDPKDKATGYLRLSCDANSLGGQWRSPDGSKPLPIVAHPIDDNDYNTARLANLKPTSTRTEHIGNNTYEILDFPLFVNGLHLLGNAPGIARINATLWGNAKSAIDAALGAGTDARDSGGDHESAESMKPLVWNESYIVIATSDDEGGSGMSHSNSETNEETYDLSTGNKVDVATWLQKNFLVDDEIPKNSPLGKLLIKAYLANSDHERECAGAIGFSSLGIYPMPKQLMFVAGANYVDTPCIDDVALPIDVVMPYLTPAGREALQKFR